MLAVDDDPFGPVVASAPAPKASKPKAPPVETAPYTGPIAFTIFGEAASKANSRELVTVGPKDDRRTLFRKSDKALTYEENALKQIPPKARVRLTARVKVTLRIFYSSERPDLDESIVLDVMQDRWRRPKRGPDNKPVPRVLVQAGVYCNDRQVKEKHVYWGIDKLMPRTEVLIEAISPVDGVLL